MIDQLCRRPDTIVTGLESVMSRSSRLIHRASRRIMCKSGNIMGHYAGSMPWKGCCAPRGQRFTACTRSWICRWPRGSQLVLFDVYANARTHRWTNIVDVGIYSRVPYNVARNQTLRRTVFASVTGDSHPVKLKSTTFNGAIFVSLPTSLFSSGRSSYSYLS